MTDTGVGTLRKVGAKGSLVHTEREGGVPQMRVPELNPLVRYASLQKK